MENEEKAEAIAEVAQVETPEVPAQPTVEALRAQLEQSSKDLRLAREQAQSHLASARKNQADLEKARASDGKITQLEQRLEVITDMLAASLDREEAEPEEQPKKRRSEEFLARLKNQPKVADIARQRDIEEYQQAALEADGLVKSIGLEMDKSPETRVAYLLFKTGDSKAGLEEVKRLIEGKKSSESTETEAEKEAKLEQAVRARLIRDFPDLYKSDTGQPSGASGSTEKAYAKYARGEISETEAVKAGVKF